MKKVDSVYVMKCRDAKDPYPHIVNGNFRKLTWKWYSSIGITQRYVHLANDELDTQYNKVFNGY